ncbi:MAG: hypothetical protein ACRD8Z_10065, partial [Nitrososphaeraceae archaeon]
AIAVVIAIALPDLPTVIGGIIGGCGVYPVVAKLTGYTQNGRLTPKGIGNNIGYGEASQNSNSHTPTPPGTPSTELKAPSTNKLATHDDVKANVRSEPIDSTIEKIIDYVSPYWSDQQYKGRG